MRPIIATRGWAQPRGRKRGNRSAARRRKKERAKPKVRSAEEQHIIDRAKSLLIERNHMTESEAHRYMQKCSMDSGTNLVETAQMVLTLLTE
mgnify:CR=1 FL=1